MYSEEDLLPISALQHLSYCPRQCALIHLDRIWTESRHTAEGRVLHQRVHERGSESRVERLIVRGLSLRSLEHGLVGVADVVEFHRAGADDAHAVRLPRASGRWLAHPVEHKRGRPKKGSYDEIQVCAQALCLEEMLGTWVPAGSLYYGQTRRRTPVELSAELREATFSTIRSLRRMLAAEGLPPAEPGPKCKLCSLVDECLPSLCGRKRSASRYLKTAIARLTSDREGG